MADFTLTVRPRLVSVHFIRRKKLRSVLGSLTFLEPDGTKREKKWSRLRVVKEQRGFFIYDCQRFYGFSLQLQPADLICIKRRHKSLKGLLCGEIKKKTTEKGSGAAATDQTVRFK